MTLKVGKSMPHPHKGNPTKLPTPPVKSNIGGEQWTPPSREEYCRTAFCRPIRPEQPAAVPRRRRRQPREAITPDPLSRPFVMGDRRNEPFQMGTSRKDRIAERKRREAASRHERLRAGTRQRNVPW